MAHTLSSLLTHIVFSTKYRYPFLRDIGVRERTFAYINGIIQELHGKTIIINGMPDHGHILASFPPALAIADAVRTIKANSSRWLSEEGLVPEFRWQTGYAAFSIGRTERNRIINYIKNQEAHHRAVTFEDEYLKLLRDYDVEYDPRFVLD